MINITDNYYDFHSNVNNPDKYEYGELYNQVVTDKLMETRSLQELNSQKTMNALK